MTTVYVSGGGSREEYWWEYLIVGEHPFYATGSSSVSPANCVLGPILMGVKYALIQCREMGIRVIVPFGSCGQLEDAAIWAEVGDVAQLIDEREAVLEMHSVDTIEEVISER